MSNFNNVSKALLLALLAIILGSANETQGQVKFRIELLDNGVTYRASSLPVTWNVPLIMTSTAQEAIKAPTGGFQVSNLTSLIPSTFWAQNARFNTQIEAPYHDYIGISLTSWCDTATVTIIAIPAVLAIDDAYMTLPGQSVMDNLADNDDLPGIGPAKVSLLPNSSPAHGPLSLQTNGDFSYLLNANFVGNDVFQYIICKTTNVTTCNTAVVAISVTPGLVAVNDQYSTSAGASLTMDFLKNDLLSSGNISSIFIMPGTVCPGGTVQLFAEGGNGYRNEWRQVGQLGIISTMQNSVLINVLQNSTYELTVTSEGCGSSATATMTVTMNTGASIANISGGGTYCHGSGVTLLATNSVAGSRNV